MIKDGFMYIAVLIFLAAILVNLPRIFKGRIAQNIFSFAPPVVLIYMGMMLLCTMKMWDLGKQQRHTAHSKTRFSMQCCF